MVKAAVVTPGGAAPENDAFQAGQIQVGRGWKECVDHSLKVTHSAAQAIVEPGDFDVVSLRKLDPLWAYPLFQGLWKLKTRSLGLIVEVACQGHGRVHV